MSKPDKEIVEELRRIRMLLTVALVRWGIDPTELTTLTQSANQDERRIS